MTDNDDTQALRPASPDEFKAVLSYALRYLGRRRVDTVDDIMAQVTAERLALLVEQSGMVVMKRPDAAAPSTSGHKHPHKG
jgi:hypothetical protein